VTGSVTPLGVILTFGAARPTRLPGAKRFRIFAGPRALSRHAGVMKCNPCISADIAASLTMSKLRLHRCGWMTNERADDPDVRKLLLKTAREWTQGAAVLRRAAANGTPPPTSEDVGAPLDDDCARKLSI